MKLKKKLSVTTNALDAFDLLQWPDKTRQKTNIKTIQCLRL